MGRHSLPGSGEPDEAPGTGWQGRRRATAAGRRGVSTGVIAALATVVALVGGIILWRFFGDALSHRSSDAARQCVQGNADIAVVADPSIAGNVSEFAAKFNADASPVGDKCVNVVVTEAGSDAVLAGLTGTWPTDLGARPALWIPASSIPPARLQAALGPAVVSDARSLVTSPVLLAVRPELKATLGERSWSDLPGLQRDLPGWGGLRLALPSAGAADADYLAAEAVAVTSAPPGASATAGLPAATALLAGQPRLSDDTADTAWKALTSDGDATTAAVHAVALTEQQLYRRTAGLSDAGKTVADWIPAGPVALADYPTVLLAGDWLAEEQVSAASEFARFMRKPEQLAQLAEAGFRAEGSASPKSDVVGFGELAESVRAGDDAVRATVAGAVSPGEVASTTIMLNRSLASIGSLRDRIAALPPGAAVGLWTFDGTGSGVAVPFGSLADQVGGRARQAVITDAVGGVAPGSVGAVSFTTLRLVYGDALANFRPGQQNSVLVITSGPHTDQTLGGAGLQDFVKAAFDPNRPVAINVIDVGDDPDRPVWEAVAQQSGGSYARVPASDSPEFTAAISRMLS